MKALNVTIKKNMLKKKIFLKKKKWFIKKYGKKLFSGHQNEKFAATKFCVEFLNQKFRFESLSIIYF